MDLDALVVLGGDGSFRIMRRLAEQGGIDLVGIPKTIDNDLSKTENAIGFVTAVNVATEALDRLQPTAASHSRLMILEVMGRDAGHIALASGLAGGGAGEKLCHSSARSVQFAVDRPPSERSEARRGQRFI